MTVAAGFEHAQGAGAGSLQLAQAGTCTSWFNSCAARCKKDKPTDRACVSDHCSPKLAQCKASGCYSEGKDYGGAQHCGLKRG